MLGGAGYGAARNLTLTVLIHLLRLRTLRTCQARVLGRFYASKPKDGKDGSLVVGRFYGSKPTQAGLADSTHRSPSPLAWASTRRICQLPSSRLWASMRRICQARLRGLRRVESANCQARVLGLPGRICEARFCRCRTCKARFRHSSVSTRSK